MTATPQPQVDTEELEALVRACPDDTGMGYCAACSYTIGQRTCATRYQFRYGTKKPTVLALIAEVRALRAVKLRVHELAGKPWSSAFGVAMERALDEIERITR